MSAYEEADGEICAEKTEAAAAEDPAAILKPETVHSEKRGGTDGSGAAAGAEFSPSRAGRQGTHSKGGLRSLNELCPQGEMIRTAVIARKAAGLTQKQLAEKMGTAQANISRFESGNANPSLEFLQRMASSLGCTLKIQFEKTRTD